MLTSRGTVSAWSELGSCCGAVVSQLSAHLFLEYRGGCARNGGQGNLHKEVEMGDVFQVH